MEAYLPYIAVSTLTSFLGGITYKYYNNDESNNNESNNDDVFNYNIIDDEVKDLEEVINNNLEKEDDIDEVIGNEIIKLNTNIDNVDKILDERNNNKYLGRTRNQKMDNMRRICREECNIVINNSNKKSKNRLMRYIKDYESKGHKEFVLSNKKTRL